MKLFCHHQHFLLKNTFKEALHYLFNVFILFNTVSNLKLKIDPKMCTFRNMEKILKTWRKFAENIWQPCKLCIA